MCKYLGGLLSVSSLHGSKRFTRTSATTSMAARYECVALQKDDQRAAYIPFFE